MTTINYHLEPSLDRFVTDMVNGGHYSSSNEVMNTALNLLREKENNLAELRRLIDEGMESGVSSRSPEEIRKAVKAKLNV